MKCNHWWRHRHKHYHAYSGRTDTTYKVCDRCCSLRELNPVYLRSRSIHSSVRLPNEFIQEEKEEG